MPRRRPIRVQSTLVKEAAPEFSPLAAYVVLDTDSAISFSKLLKPKPEAIADMLRKLADRKKWSPRMMASVLNINEQRVRNILSGKRAVDGSISRLIWILSELDSGSDLLTNPLYYATWGKSKGVAPRKAQVPGGAVNWKPRPKFPKFLMPSSPWVYVDWSIPFEDIAKQMNVTRRTVWERWNEMRKLPKAMVVRAFRDVSRINQAGIVIRGKTRSFRVELEKAELTAQR